MKASKSFWTKISIRWVDRQCSLRLSFDVKFTASFLQSKKAIDDVYDYYMTGNALQEVINVYKLIMFMREDKV